MSVRLPAALLFVARGLASRLRLKPCRSLQWHFSKGRRKPAHLEAQTKQRLRQVSLQSLSRLLQHGHGQVVSGSKTQGVAVVADLPMRPPSASGDAPLMMSREATQFSHKTKRGLRCQPGKPLWGVWLKREETLIGADHDVASFWPILDAR